MEGTDGMGSQTSPAPGSEIGMYGTESQGSCGGTSQDVGAAARSPPQRQLRLKHRRDGLLV